jgi:hypothetical protein
MMSRVVPILLLCLGFASAVPFLSKKKSTPLIFIKMPNGSDPITPKMDKVVSNLEKELGVHVERLDARDPSVAILLSSLSGKGSPLLYNRESCQVVNWEDFKNEARLRAWAKGRFLPARGATAKSKPKVIEQDDDAIDQEDLIEDMSLSPLQKSGKEAIKKRTEEKAKEASN